MCCSNVSSDGEYARHKLRECNGLVDAVVAVVRASVSIVEMDSKAVENCVCVMRNLSYACQEVADPEYLRRREVKAASHDGTYLFFIILHCEAGKRNQFSFVCISFNTRQKLVNFFVYIKEYISYNFVYLLFGVC